MEWAAGSGGGVSVWNFAEGRGQRQAWSSGHREEEDGYAAVDALVALMILASTLVCAISATHSSRAAADMALEIRRANELAGYLLEVSPTTPGETVGQAEGFDWRRIVGEPVDTFGASAICERRVVLTGVRDKRRFETRTNAVCPAALES